MFKHIMLIFIQVGQVLAPGLAHVQGGNAILAQYNSPSPFSVTEHLLRQQLKFVTVLH
jgi:hypothetical protein